MSSAALVPGIGAVGSLATIMIVCALGGALLVVSERIAAKRRVENH